MIVGGVGRVGGTMVGGVGGVGGTGPVVVPVAGRAASASPGCCAPSTAGGRRRRRAGDGVVVGGPPAARPSAAREPQARRRGVGVGGGLRTWSGGRAAWAAGVVAGEVVRAGAAPVGGSGASACRRSWRAGGGLRLRCGRLGRAFAVDGVTPICALPPIAGGQHDRRRLGRDLLRRRRDGAGRRGHRRLDGAGRRARHDQRAVRIERRAPAREPVALDVVDRVGDRLRARARAADRRRLAAAARGARARGCGAAAPAAAGCRRDDGARPTIGRRVAAAQQLDGGPAAERGAPEVRRRAGGGEQREQADEGSWRTHLWFLSPTPGTQLVSIG